MDLRLGLTGREQCSALITMKIFRLSLELWKDRRVPESRLETKTLPLLFKGENKSEFRLMENFCSA